MPKLDINKPELIWPGKYDEDGNRIIQRGAALPFQVIETIREGRATREPGRTADLFSYANPAATTDWKNKLVWGDNLLVMSSLVEQYAGKVDLIYIDPPFATGADFKVSTIVGDYEVEKQQSAIEEKAYRDTWGGGLGTYLQMMYDRLSLFPDLLSHRGSVFVHLDPTVVHYVKVMLDEIFGHSNGDSTKAGFRNELAWCYSGGGIPQREFPRKHDVILWYTKSNEWVFNVQYRPYSEGTVQRGRTAVKGPDAQLRDEGTPVNDWWPDIKKITSPTDPEKLYYPTQKSEALLERVIRVASNEGDTVLDVFAGSGTTLAVAEKLNRRWIGCDLGRFAVHTTRKRLLDIPNCKPFEVLNLGQYERKYWQGVKFGDQRPEEPGVAAVAAYVSFILSLYRAQPVSGTHVHGRKGGALVHVGAVDAPVTIREVNDAVAECAALRQKELHVLGWEWEMGLHDPMAQAALREHGIRLRLLSIPREVMERRAVEVGDIRFFDLAHLEAELEHDAKHPRKVNVKLKGFAIPDTDLIPDEVRDKIRKWSDYIDYWAVDWDFKHDTFMNAWQAYRTRQNRKLALTSDAHDYPAAGRYQVLIKVVDIFGNDTSRLIECKVK